MSMKKLSSIAPLITILVGSLCGNAYFIYHIQTSPRQVQVRQEIASQTGTSEVKPSPNPSLQTSHQQSQDRFSSITADETVAVDDVLEEDLAAELLTENEWDNKLILGLIDSGYSKDQIMKIMYDPGSLPQPEPDGGLETLTPEDRELEDELIDGLIADGRTDSEIDAILYDPNSVPQPDRDSGLETLTPEDQELEDELIDGLIADGRTDWEIDAILYDPNSVPQPDRDSGLEALTPEDRELEDQLIDGLIADGQSDWEIDAILYDPESLSQPDNQISFLPTPEQRARVEDAGL